MAVAFNWFAVVITEGVKVFIWLIQVNKEEKKPVAGIRPPLPKGWCEGVSAFVTCCVPAVRNQRGVFHCSCIGCGSCSLNPSHIATRAWWVWCIFRILNVYGWYALVVVSLMSKITICNYYVWQYHIVYFYQVSVNLVTGHCHVYGKPVAGILIGIILL